MKFSGITRKLDSSGRVILPIGLRRRCGLESADYLEFAVEGDTIVLSKYRPACIFCGTTDNVTKYVGKYLCKDCLLSFHRGN
ncbi:MAG: AbrB/MazE/SpoVT family DNA-binding domain-containing protein [Negativicutes bacterium]|nr:AbrB/MazE/SpoVT family DNA-binding domain-containing protein [Negativicutes bacterium]